jgi:fimbrial isopeptide formation D2 family protein
MGGALVRRVWVLAVFRRRSELDYSSGRAIFAIFVFVFSMFVLLAGLLVVFPVNQAVADSPDYGPDGYFRGTGGSGPQLIKDVDSEADARKVIFGKSGQLSNAATVVESGDPPTVQVDGQYLYLARGPQTSRVTTPIENTSFQENSKTATTPLDEGEVLLWATDMMTSTFAFDGTTNSPGYSCGDTACNGFDYGTATDGVASYESRLAKVSHALDSEEYFSALELRQLGDATQLVGVCNKIACHGGSSTAGTSTGSYRVFPLTMGDAGAYFDYSSTGITRAMAQLQCPANSCASGAAGTLLRSSDWRRIGVVTGVRYDGAAYFVNAHDKNHALRPAVRVQLADLLLSADADTQAQDGVGDVRLTFVDSGKRLTSWMGWVSGVAGSRELKLLGESELGSVLGWKIVDPVTKKVLGSGRTSNGGNMVLPELKMTDESKDYDLYVWGQQDGSAASGLSNRATEPVKTTIRGWQVASSRPYEISLTGITAGELTAYKIGDYAESVFDQTGALKSVRISTPADPVKASVLAVADATGASSVDVDNPMGWVASRWLGYPTEPLSDDVTSAFSPYAGSLQLFAQQLAGKSDAELGGVKSMPLAGVSGSATLKVSGPGLYLIVDSTQGSGGSLPIIVGTKVFNEALGEDGGFVDFTDAGVKGKPRLGQAALKTTVTDIAKRIVNDAGMDGFDVGSEVEFEIALRVPDLSSFTSVAYDSYKFNLTDVAASGLTLPADGSGVEVFVDALSPTEPQSLPPGLIAVSGDTLTVDGLKVLFAESDGVSGVKNKNTVPAGSLMRLRYKAVLNASAVVSSPVEGESLKPNVNTVTLTRSYTDSATEGWTDNSDGTESKSAAANAYTFKVDVVKLDKDDLSKKLGDVGFEVSRDGQKLKFTKLSDGEYRLGDASGTEVVVTKSDGTLSLQGVEARELSFKETNAPSGYFKVSDFTVDVRPVWNADATQVTKVTYATSGTNLAYVSQDGGQVVVLDPAWSLANLPYTGGMGILVLLVVGGLVLAFAIRPYILSKRAERDANLV